MAGLGALRSPGWRAAGQPQFPGRPQLPERPLLPPPGPGRPPLLGPSTGAGYAACSRLWWQEYLREPATHARSESRAVLALGAVTIVVALVALVLNR